MSPWLVIFTGLIYLYIGIEQGFKGSWGTTIMFLGYAFSNIGLYLQVK